MICILNTFHYSQQQSKRIWNFSIKITFTAQIWLSELRFWGTEGNTAERMAQLTSADRVAYPKWIWKICSLCFSLWSCCHYPYHFLNSWGNGKIKSALRLMSSLIQNAACGLIAPLKIIRSVVYSIRTWESTCIQDHP